MGELYNPFPRTPKNIRQIGERDQTVRLYLEDYVNTYLKRLCPKGGQDLRVGVLLGTAEERDGVPFLFVDGAMEIEDVTEPGEKVHFTEQAWRKTYQGMEQMFPKRVILGWFLCGAAGCTLSPLNYWKEHGKYFAAKNQLMYLSGGLDGEEAVYVAAEEGFSRLRGYSIYYERNQMMQDYMILRKDVRRVESGAGDPVIRDFRQRMEENKSQLAQRRGTVHVLGGLCTMLGIVVLAGGVIMMNNYEKMKKMEAVLASVLPAGLQNEEEAAEGGQAGGGFFGLAGIFGGESDENEPQSEADGRVSVDEVAGNLQLAAGNENAGLPGWNAAGGNGALAEAGASGTDGSSGGNAGGVSGGGGVSGSAGMAGAGGTSGSAGMSEPGGTIGSAGMNGAGGMNASAGTPEGAAGTSDGGVSAVNAAGGAGATNTGNSSGSPDGTSVAGESAPQAQTAESAAAPAREVLAGQTLYLVQPGDTLYGICLDKYGDGSRMQEICELNGLKNEDTITAGENLILP